VTAAKLLKAARRLADRPYEVEYVKERTVDGKRQVVVARHPQLPGCMAQGDSPEEATSQLDEARIEYIASLLEASLPVPDPTNAHLSPAGPRRMK